MRRKVMSNRTPADFRSRRIAQLLVAATIACFSAPVFAAELHVGPARDLRTLQAGVAAAKANDRIILDPGIYTDDAVTIDKPLVIQGGGRGAVLRASKPISNRKGLLVVNADLTVRKITFEGAFVSDADGKNGAGIRHQAGRLVVDTCVFNNNQNGILANANKDSFVTIRRSTFSGNGAGDGYTHGIYINAVAHLIVTDSVFTGTKVGHDIKSRALKTTITNTVLDDGVTGIPSYAIDLPNGGEATLRGVRITQGPKTNNPTMVAFGAEKNLHEQSSLTVSGSAFSNRAPTSVGINNFTSIAVILEGNSFENLGETARGPVRINRNARPPVRTGLMFSGVDPNALSYLRIHNTGNSPGTASVRLFDSRDGRFLGAWDSPMIQPNAAPQFSIREVEGALQLQERPVTYTAVITSNMTGTVQSVLHRAASGALSNLSVCTAGVTRAGRQIAGVHTSNLDLGYPASIAIRNDGAVAAAAQVGLYDARDGRRMAGLVTPEIGVNAELILPVRQLEAAARTAPPWDQGHWTLKIENEFQGSLQQLVANQTPSILTDITTVCDLSAAPQEPPASIELGGVFPRLGDVQSVLRIYNRGNKSGPVHIDLFDAISGAWLAHRDSGSLPPNGTRDMSVSELLTPGDPKIEFVRVAVESEVDALVQHLVRHPAREAVTNLSSCDAGTSASLRDLIGIRSASAEGGNLALMVVYNAGGRAAAASLQVFDALDGRGMGEFVTAPVSANGNLVLSIVDLETSLALSAHGGSGMYNVRLSEDFSGLIQHLLVSAQTGLVTDMTTACAVRPAVD